MEGVGVQLQDGPGRTTFLGADKRTPGLALLDAMAQWPSPLVGLGAMELREADDLSGGRQAAGGTGRADLS